MPASDMQPWCSLQEIGRHPSNQLCVGSNTIYVGGYQGHTMPTTCKCDEETVTYQKTKTKNNS